MGLSRLDNFLNSPRGTIFYVDANALDATDAIENKGTSQARPFRTIQRALAEVARFSYQRGDNNDRFSKSTVLVSPGTYFVDNRPGAVVRDNGELTLRSSAFTEMPEWDLTSNFDLAFDDNDLYKLNSVHGGIILPRGCSLIGMDLRKVKIVPLYVPDPLNDDIERSAVFRVTGACFFFGFTILDSDPNGTCYKDYTKNLFVPNFSHHKLTVFEYADGVNPVVINDEFQPSPIVTTRTDLEMYYDKIARVYGDSTGRDIADPTYGTGGVIDIQPTVDEYRIVGSRGREVGITSIRAGDGNLNPSNIITVDLSESIAELTVDSPIQISGVGAKGYDGQYVVSNFISPTVIQYRVQNTPQNPKPGVAGALLNLVVDTVTSASPYIFNCSLRSVYGMCGLHADGNKADGFKSMVVAQYTGIGLQKDDRAFVQYNTTTGEYEGSNSIPNLHTSSRARFKPEYENYHIKASNNAFLQLVSVFAIGYAQHFLAESGGDYSITNSNSNFGAKSLIASGFRPEAFPKDDVGYITHIIPPQELETEETSVEFLSIDVGLTTSASAGAAATTRLYLYGSDNFNIPPTSVFDGYRIGAKPNETLKVQIFENGTKTEYSSKVVIPDTEFSSEKSYDVESISSSTLKLETGHLFENGESVRIISDNGHLPDGLDANQIYYVITNENSFTEAVGLGTTQVKLAQTFNNAILGESLEFNTKGGKLKVISRVSDKDVGDYGHPIQWDVGRSNWYINVSSSDNSLYDKIKELGVNGLGEATSRTYINRKSDTRTLIDTIYRFRYVIPSSSPIESRPPLDGYIIQESSSLNIADNDDFSYFDLSEIENSTQLRNPKFISNATWSSKFVTVTTEVPHNLSVGTEVEIKNVLPTGYNGSYAVTEVINSRQFKYKLDTNPGSFASDIVSRTEDLPRFIKKTLPGTYQVYQSEEIQPYVPNEQDGVYYVTVVNCSNSPTVDYFNTLKFNQPIQNLYPQTNRDDPKSDPDSSTCFALPTPIGQVVINDPQLSITKETLEKSIKDFNVGVALSSIVSNSTGTAHTIVTTVDHGFSGITSVRILTGGSNYLTGTYYAANLVGFAGSTTGSNSSVKIVVNDLGSGIGTVTAVEIMYGGSAYGIGNTLSVVPPAGVGTATGFIPAIVEVTIINNDIDEGLSISGAGGTFSGYNNSYRITEVSNPNTIKVSSASTVTGYWQTSIGSTALSKTSLVRTGKVLEVDSFEYTSSAGIATIGFTTSHGLSVNNKIRLSGFDNDYFNKDVVIKRQNSLESIVVNIGKGGEGIPTTGTPFVYRNGYTSNGGTVTKTNENISGRLIPKYGGVTSILTDELTVTSDLGDPLKIKDAVRLGLKLGDYLQVNDEIFRIREYVDSDEVSVFRSLFGTERQTHVTGSVVRRIEVLPIQFHRHSIIRASGHTFEYVGFGPGNYSTALPERQDRLLSPQEELLAQATKENGGLVIFTAMNGDGDLYTGSKKVNSSTGQEEVYNSPIPTVTGEDISFGTLSAGFNVLTPLEATITRSIRVEGGPESNLISEFDGPVIFNNKITSYSDKGIESNSLYLQGNEAISRRISINFDKPDFSGNYGDIEFNSEPQKYGFAGWIYTTENEWQPWGFIGGPGVGIASNGTYVGFSTLVNFQTSGLTLKSSYNSPLGITTLRLEADPRVRISTNAQNTTVGFVTQLNFIGAAVSVTGSTSAGIATISVTVPAPDGVGVPTLPFNSFQYNDGGQFGGVKIASYDDRYLDPANGFNGLLVFGDVDGYNSLNNTLTNTIIVTSDGRVGFASTVPQSKVEIVVDNERAIYIKSRQGSEIIRIDSESNDTTPFIIDGNGYLGINTSNPLTDLDVIGNTSINGQLRIYKTGNRTNYVGFVAPTLTSNYVYTLPSSYGTNGQVLSSNGSGTLSWKTVTEGNLVSAGTGINISFNGQNATISNDGVRKIVAGSGIQISPTNGVGDVTVSAVPPDPVNLYPYTTRGFSMPI